MSRGTGNGKSKEVREGNLSGGDGERKNKCKINREKYGQTSERDGVYIFSLWREENYRLLTTMCLAGHK